MKPLTRRDLLSLQDYERQRDSFRSRIIALEQRPRLSLGPLISVVVQKRDTLPIQGSGNDSSQAYPKILQKCQEEMNLH